jgi:hypothetical protein
MIVTLLASLPGPALAASPGNWLVSTVSGDVKYYPFASIAFDKDNTPHVVFRNNVTRNILHAWQSDGVWTAEKVGPSAGTFTTSITIDDGGNPAISYGDGIYLGNLMLARKITGSWERTIVARGSAADAGQHSSLAFDQWGIPHITYNDGQILGSLYYATLDTIPGIWKFSLIDDGGIPYIGDAGYSPSLKIDAGGHPHVAYISDDPWGLRYATSRDGVNWTITNLDELGRMNFFSRTYTGPSLALDSREYPHISYLNHTTRYTAPVELRYLSWDGTAWNRESVITLNKRDFTTSLAIDAQDVPHIAYCDVGEGSVNYATRSPSGVWSSEVAVHGKNLLRWPSLALDQAGSPGIVYYELTDHALKFAKRMA